MWAGDSAILQQTRGLAGGSARAWACWHECANGRGWYRGQSAPAEALLRMVPRANGSIHDLHQQQPASVEAANICEVMNRNDDNNIRFNTTDAKLEKTVIK